MNNAYFMVHINNHTEGTSAKIGPYSSSIDAAYWGDIFVRKGHALNMSVSAVIVPHVLRGAEEKVH